MYKNGKKIFQNHKTDASKNVMYCLNGIRVLSIAWVVLGHSYMVLIVGPLINTLALQKVHSFINFNYI